MINVLVVDDSALVRETMEKILCRDPEIRVEKAADPFLAMEKMARLRPDVILLDLEMPRMDGLTFLKKIMAEDPLPVVICSGLAPERSEIALDALSAGAVEVISKSQLGIRDFLEESSVRLTDAVRAAALTHPGRRAAESPIRGPRPPDAVARPKSSLRLTTDKVIAIGTSTGGTDALREILTKMPPDTPGILVVQHMPEGFTRAFADRLNTLCQITVKEAADGDAVTSGLCLIAPGNHHLLLKRTGGHYKVQVTGGAFVSRHRPSVNVLFRSVAQEAGANAVGVILTGMGDDGADGLLDMRHAGAQTFAQDEASSVVYGMPKVATERGAVQEVHPLKDMAAAILKSVGSKTENTPKI